MWLNVPCFSVSDKHGQTSNVIWLSTTWLLIFRLEVGKKKLLFTKPSSTWIEISCYKDIIFHGYKISYSSPGYTGKILFANASNKKLGLNTSTWYFLNYLQFTEVGTRKGVGVIWVLEAITFYLFMH